MAQREGYLYVDHTASPGIPADLAVQLGLDPMLVREGKVFEAATLTCAHCSGAEMRGEPELRAKCMKCGGKFICAGCAFEAHQPGYSHLPFEKKVDLVKEAEAKGIPILGSPPALLQPPKG